eukprot:3256320-Rhodomonas_salina.9
MKTFDQSLQVLRTLAANAYITETTAMISSSVLCMPAARSSAQKTMQSAEKRSKSDDMFCSTPTRAQTPNTRSQQPKPSQPPDTR